MQCFANIREGGKKRGRLRKKNHIRAGAAIPCYIALAKSYQHLPIQNQRPLHYIAKMSQMDLYNTCSCTIFFKPTNMYCNMS